MNQNKSSARGKGDEDKKSTDELFEEIRQQPDEDYTFPSDSNINLDLNFEDTQVTE